MDKKIRIEEKARTEGKSEIEEKIEIIVSLSKKQKRDCLELLEDCKRKDKRKIDFFMEQEWNDISDFPCFFLLYSGIQLDCLVSVFLIEGEAELSAVTRVERRRKGLFSKVIKEVFAVLTLYQIRTVIFRVEEKNDLALSVLRHWGAEKRQTDCLMKILPSKEIFKLYWDAFQKEEETEMENIVDGQKEKQEVVWHLEEKDISEKIQELLEVHASAFGGSKAESEWIFESGLSDGMELWGYLRGGEIIGLCFVSKEEDGYFLSGVSICRRKQRKGYGERFLRRLLLQLWEQKQMTVFLQVTKENTAAFRLYQKLGFHIWQKLVTYLIEKKL